MIKTVSCIRPLDFVLARSWSYDKTDESCLLVEHSNMLSLGWNVITRRLRPRDDMSTSGQHIWMFHLQPCIICIMHSLICLIECEQQMLAATWQKDWGQQRQGRRQPWWGWSAVCCSYTDSCTEGVRSLSVQRGGQFRYMTALVHMRSISVHVFFVVRLWYMRSTISVHHYVDIGTLQENVCLFMLNVCKCWMDV